MSITYLFHKIQVFKFNIRHLKKPTQEEKQPFRQIN